jgi:hypothetical protein
MPYFHYGMVVDTFHRLTDLFMLDAIENITNL